MGVAQKISTEDLIKELIRCRGIVGSICKSYGITRQSVWRRIHDNKDIRAAFDEGRELIKDSAENKLVKAVSDNKRWAIEKVIDKMCHSRGYIDKQEITQDTTIKDESSAKQEMILSKMTNEELESFTILKKQQIELMSKYE